MLTYKAHAKLNLTLEVLGRRPDGYHSIASVMQTIDLEDTLDLEPGSELTLECNIPSLQAPDNLAFRAARLLQQEAGVRRGVRMRLTKGIPTGVGLGGGSSDAACVLRTLNVLWGVGFSPGELASLAEMLGSDVPFFLQEGTALVEGKGERVTYLPPCQPFWAVIMVPPMRLEEKTRSLYSMLREEHFGNGKATRRLAELLAERRDLSYHYLTNTFDLVADQAFPSLDVHRKALLEAGAPRVHLTGTGPALYSIFTAHDQAQRVWQNLKATGKEAYLAGMAHRLRSDF